MQMMREITQHSYLLIKACSSVSLLSIHGLRDNPDRVRFLSLSARAIANNKTVESVKLYMAMEYIFWYQKVSFNDIVGCYKTWIHGTFRELGKCQQNGESKVAHSCRPPVVRWNGWRCDTDNRHEVLLRFNISRIEYLSPIPDSSIPTGTLHVAGSSLSSLWRLLTFV